MTFIFHAQSDEKMVVPVVKRVKLLRDGDHVTHLGNQKKKAAQETTTRQGQHIGSLLVGIPSLLVNRELPCYREMERVRNK